MSYISKIRVRSNDGKRITDYEFDQDSALEWQRDFVFKANKITITETVIKEVTETIVIKDSKNKCEPPKGFVCLNCNRDFNK